MNERKISVIGKLNSILVEDKLNKPGFIELMSICPVKEDTPIGFAFQVLTGMELSFYFNIFLMKSYC